MLGGHLSKLRLPTACVSTNESKALLDLHEEKLNYFTERRGELASIIRRSTNAEERHATKKQLLELISSKAWLPYDYMWLHTCDATSAAIAAPAPPPPPPDSNSDQALTASDLRWLVACGAATACSPLHAIYGRADVLRYVCDIACVGGLARWAPTPQPPRLRMVEQHLCLEHRRSWLLGQHQLDERDLLIDELRTAAVRMECREQHAFEQAAAAVNRARNIQNEESDRFTELIAETEKYITRLHREYGREKKAMGTEWQLKVNQSENLGAAAVQANKVKMRSELAAIAAQRDAALAEHAKEAAARAQVEAQLQAEHAASAKLREMRTGSELLKRRALEEECTRLRQRRTCNQRRISDYNLGERRVQVAQQVQTTCFAC
jgi:hypothetical protein